MKTLRWTGLGVTIGGAALWGLVQANQMPVSVMEIEDEIDFSLADADRDGVVSRAELERRHEEVLLAFDLADKDADGRLTKEEFLLATQTTRELSPG